MARYHFADVEAQLAERAFDVPPDAYRGNAEESDFDTRPDPADLIDRNEKRAWYDRPVGPG